MTSSRHELRRIYFHNEGIVTFSDELNILSSLDTNI